LFDLGKVNWWVIIPSTLSGFSSYFFLNFGIKKNNWKWMINFLQCWNRANHVWEWIRYGHRPLSITT
jgi:hypothetical protein